MPFLIQYLIKLSLSLALVWLFYQLVLRRLTFYYWNRWFLLCYSLLAFFIPLIDVSPVLQQARLIDHEVVRFIPVVEKFTTAEKALSLSEWDWTFMLFAAGCLVLMIRFTIQHISFLRLRRSAELILENPVKVYQVNDHIIPFSFGNAIFINHTQHSEEDLKEIIKHEFVHVRQKHSIDMLWAEWLCILNWYNPFAWLIRSAVRQNLEFIADSKVVQNAIDKKQYQYLLLKVIGAPQYGIATNFNFSSLKKRIAMMNKIKSAKVQLVKFLFLLPIIAGTLLAFRHKVSNQQNQNNAVTRAGIQDTIPVRPNSPDKSKDTISKYGIKITVTSKDGKKVEYDLENPEEKAAFEKKYVPLPPIPPHIPEKMEVAPPAPPKAPAVRRLPENVSNIHIDNEKATIRLKNGKVERYDLSKPDEKEAFERKYGDLTPVIPQAPAAPSAPSAPLAPVVSTTITVTGVEPVVAGDVLTPVASIATTVSAEVFELRPAIHSLSPGEKEELITEITRQTTKGKLDELKKELAAKGYTLSISGLHYNNDILQSIEGTIADEESKSRFLAHDFSKIIISQITYKNRKSGFYIRILDGIIRM